MEATEFQVLRQLPGAGAITLEGETLGEGPPVVLLHGLSATRRNVVQGSRALVKRGYRLISYDARGHGRSCRPRPPTRATRAPATPTATSGTSSRARSTRESTGSWRWRSRPGCR